VADRREVGLAQVVLVAAACVAVVAAAVVLTILLPDDLESVVCIEIFHTEPQRFLRLLKFGASH